MEYAAVPQSESPAPVEHWGLATRIAFRFCVAYFTLFSLSNQILGGLFLIPKLNIPDLSSFWPLKHITFWTAHHIFHVQHDLVYTGSGSGDKTFDWVLAFCLLIIAAFITCVYGPFLTVAGKITSCSTSGFGWPCASRWLQRCFYMALSK
jgi:hypothetical protein